MQARVACCSIPLPRSMAATSTFTPGLRFGSAFSADGSAMSRSTITFASHVRRFGLSQGEARQWSHAGVANNRALQSPAFASGAEKEEELMIPWISFGDCFACRSQLPDCCTHGSFSITRFSTDSARLGKARDDPVYRRCRIQEFGA